MQQRTRKLIKLADEEFQVLIHYNLSKWDTGKTSVVVPTLIDFEIENVDYREIPQHIYNQLDQECFRIISEGE